MIDLKLTAEHDLDISTGDLSLVVGIEEVAQNSKIRVLTEKYEWLFNLEVGILWTGDGGMFDTTVPDRVKESRIRAAIQGTPGLDLIQDFLFRKDEINRGALVQYRAKTVYGEIGTEITK